MALISSSPGPEYHPHRLFRLQPLLVQPSSPSLEYQDGQLSPSFDASFASSMSISSADPPLTTTSNNAFAEERHPNQAIVSSSPVQMDISPAPQRDTTSISARLAVATSQQPPRPAPGFGAEATTSQPSSNNGDYPFLRNLFHPTRPTPVHHNSTGSLPASLGIRAPSPLPETAPLSLKARREGRPSLQHAASTGSLGLRAPFELKGVQSRSSLRETDTLVHEEQASVRNSSATEDLGGEVDGPMAPPRISSKRSALPAGWNKPPSRSRHTAPAGSSTLLQAPVVPLQKRKSEPLVPTYQVDPESSPFRMDVDGASPNGRLSSPVSLRPPQHPRSVSDSRASDRDVALARDNSNPFFLPSDAYSPTRSKVVLEAPESGASDRLADLFADDLSPIPQSRKRFLEEHHSPTPASPTPTTATNSSSLFAAKPVRRSFEKAMSTTCIPQQGPIRRQRSSHALQVKKRPSLSSFATAIPPLPTHTAESAGPTTTTFGFKRHAPAINGKPKSMRRAFSVADAAPHSLLRNTSAAGKENLDSTSTVSYRSSLCNTSTSANLTDDVGYFPPLSSARRAGIASMDLGSSSEKQRPAPLETGSPITGFRSQEAKGKALPCFGVKEDGLMRISAATLNDVQSGVYSSRIKQFVIIDCRFDYEFEGGHINEAINLSDVADVDKALLSIPHPPEPSTSEYAPTEGKTVLIFHCEFSAKRAPTTAKHLRNQDRLKNHSVYPNIHYPEVYVLQGGYAEFFKAFPERCIGGYLEMDDPARLAERSVNLNHFRNQIQKRQFQRANTFTFGQAQHASTLLQAATNTREIQRPQSQVVRPRSGGLDKTFAFPSTKDTLSAMSACHEEQEHEADSSFGTQGSSPGGGDSPCPTSKMGRGSLKLGKDFGMLSMTGAAGPAARRGLERAQTSATLMFTR